MSFIAAALIGGGSALLGGYMASQGAKSAAKTQAAAQTQAATTQEQAAKDALALQEKMYERQIGLQEPYRQAGLTGQNRLMTLLGLRGQQPNAQISGGGLMGDIARAASGLVSGPYVGGDTTSADFGKYARDFGMQDYQADPGYAFRLKEGMKQLSGGARAGGGAVSGRTMMGAQDYAQGLASQEYQNAFNRYQTNRANQLQPLGNLMASGQSAASNQGAAAGQYGAAGGNLMTGAGQAIGAGQLGAGQSMAAGQLGAGNTWNNALGNLSSSYQQNQMMNRFYPVGNYSTDQIANANAMNVPQYAQPLKLG